MSRGAQVEEEVLGLGARQLEEGFQPVLGRQQPPALAEVVGGEAGLALGFATEGSWTTLLAGGGITRR
jgi:hypothetical protein